MTQTPAGWYADPDPSYTGSGRIRYWDGQQWTEHAHETTPPPYPTYQPGTAPTEYTPPPSVATTPDGQRLAGWWQRFLAIVLDAFIQFPFLLLAAAPVLASQWDDLTSWFDGVVYAAENNTADPELPAIFDPTTAAAMAFALSMLAGSVLYNVLFLRWKQATPGKLALGLRVRRRHTPGPLPWSTITVRVGAVTAVSALANMPLAALVNYLWPLWDPNKQALHDKVAGTNVVRVR